MELTSVHGRITMRSAQPSVPAGARCAATGDRLFSVVTPLGLLAAFPGKTAGRCATHPGKEAIWSHHPFFRLAPQSNYPEAGKARPAGNGEVCAGGQR